MLAAILLAVSTSISDGSCNCSTVLQRENWVVGTGAISGRQAAKSTEECCALCGQNDVCIAWVFDGISTCWLKDNTSGGHSEESRTSGYCSSVGPVPPPSPSPAPPPEPATVSAALFLGTAIVATADTRFVSYTLDWWNAQRGAPPENWGPDANVLELDFQSPRLVALTSALGPAYLRIGGSLDKDVVYAFPGSGMEWNSTDCPADLCLNASRWDQLHAFASTTSSKIVFGMSYPGKDSGVWNSSQAAAMWTYSAAKGYNSDTTMHGFEVGEELTGFSVGTPEFTAYTASYQRAAKLLASTYSKGSSGGGARPALMGPCPGMAWPELATWYPAFLEGTRGALDVAVYHSYNQYVPTGDDKVLYCNTTVPNGSPADTHGASPGGTGWQAKTIGEYGAAVNVPVWLGEGGPHNGGGHGPEANTFVASFTYLDMLGTLSEVGNAVFARQTLVGGNYELLRCSSAQLFPGETCDFEPRPDYWVALLWRRLMGPQALVPTLTAARSSVEGASASPSKMPLLSNLRVYQHCTVGSGTGMNGSVTISFSNMADVTVYSLELPTQLAAGRRYEYHLAAANATAGFEDRELMLNGKLLATVSSKTVVPALLPVEVAPGEPVVKIPPVSLGFIVFPDANLEACK